jgi:DNA invertase Pin-like site-specific DNA recombinase
LNTKVCLLIRVSTEKQETHRQLLELTGFCKDRNFEIVRTISSKISGSRSGADRPDLVKLFEATRGKEFSKVLVTEISRLGRKAKDIRATIDRLHENKVSIVFKNFGGIESLDELGNETFVTNIIISIYAELAQEERRILVERTKSGLMAARKNGKVLGRPKGKETSSGLLKRYSKLVDHLKAGRSLQECMKLHRVSKNTVIKVKRKLLS